MYIVYIEKTEELPQRRWVWKEENNGKHDHPKTSFSRLTQF